jgi:hypothetical protein
MKDDVWVRRVENGFVVTVGIEENGNPPSQYVARDMEQLCEVLRDLFEGPE